MIVAQSGGPSPVINNSLRGIIEMSRELPEIGTVYGGRHGIEGVLKEELLDLTGQPPEEVSLLRFTPAAGSIGTCRYKLKPAQTEDFDRVLEVFKAHDIGYFLYIGGNDSMDTANKVAALARERGLDVVGVGVPKTIDNDVGDSEYKLIDHTPGYGSVAKYWMHMVQNANEATAIAFVVCEIWLRPGRAPKAGTWDCGYARPSARMQYTASSFADMLVRLFRGVLRPQSETPVLDDLFAKPARFRSVVEDVVLYRFILPLIKTLTRLTDRMRVIQRGQMRNYVLYIFATVVILLLWTLPVGQLLVRLLTR
jgi:hypothetical protein